MAKCGAPGHLYPNTAADQAALIAGPETEAFWKASMVARCPAHAPSEHPAAYFAAQAEPCDLDPDIAERYGLISGPHTCDEPHHREDHAIEVAGTGKCASGHTVRPLADRVAELLEVNGISPNDPEMANWRQWNKRAREG